MGKEELWRYLVEVVVPRSIEAHQLRCSEEDESTVTNLITTAFRQLSVQQVMTRFLNDY